MLIICYLYIILSSQLFFYYLMQSQASQKVLKGVICICGNDGVGKSTLSRMIIEDSDYLSVERSSQNIHPQLIKLKEEIKMIDKLTFAYAFEDDRYRLTLSTQIQVQGKTYPVFWIMLHSQPQILKERISKRLQMTIYEHHKCIDYFNEVYHELAYFYGMILIHSSDNKSLRKILVEILLSIRSQIVPLKMKEISLNDFMAKDLQKCLASVMSEEVLQKIYRLHVLPQLQESPMASLYFPELHDLINDKSLLSAVVARWVKSNFKKQFKYQNILRLYGEFENQRYEFEVQLEGGEYYFDKIIEGQSKMVYILKSSNPYLQKLYEGKIFIVLKGTIYSHKKQHTGEITELGKVRAKGSMIFLEMLRRNNISHSYICVNKDAIILSKMVQTNELQIIFKKELLGTDKHSYHHINTIDKIVKQNNEYLGGIYIRFDWRNPNHVLNKNPDILINLDPYYYILQKFLSKERFFQIFLQKNANKCTAIGDKCISEDVVLNYTNTNKIKQMIIEAYSTFQYYANENGLQILDGCFMIDDKCQMIWSQINPDCLRVKTIREREDFDKDIWRTGGSSSKDTIMKKWTAFNEIFIKYFQSHRFMEIQLSNQKYCKQIQAQKIVQRPIRPGYTQYYNEIIRGRRQRQIIGTIDLIKGQPILVQSSIFKEKHSQGNLQAAWNYISILPQIVVVDIDGALGRQIDNFQTITRLSQKKNNNIFAVGGGIRTLQKAKHFLTCVGQIILSSNLDIIQQLPESERQKIIVELSINEDNEVLTHGRTVNTKVNIKQKIKQLCILGIKTVSITFNNSEGKLKGLPREQLRKIMFEMPGPIQKVIIAGGISSIDDIQFVWGFSKCIPQLGSAIWKKKVMIGQIYKRLVRYDQNNLVPSVIKTKNQKILGVVYLNSQAIERTCEERVLYRYSREHKKLMKKGQTSGNIQRIISLNVDCDNDSLLITVEEQNEFCHLNSNSCFFQNSLQNNYKNLNSLQSHILKSKSEKIGTGYSHKVQNNSPFAIMKMIQQIDELGLTQSKQRKVQESADMLAHLLMYLNAENVQIQDVIGVLNQRSRKIKTVKSKEEMGEQDKDKEIIIGVALGKHKSFILQFIQNNLGIKIITPKERSYQIEYEIVSRVKYQKYFTKNQIVKLLSVKPKDMLKLMTKYIIQYGINYSNTLSSFEKKSTIIAGEKVKNLRLALIKRKGKEIDYRSWTPTQKGYIASEYPHEVFKFLTAKGISSDCYGLIRINGQSESYLVLQKFDLCDAIVQTGQTIKRNNLEIEAVLCPFIETILFKLDQ